MCAISLQYIMAAYHFLFLSGITASGVALYLYAMTITEDIKISLNAINEDAKKNKTRLQAFKRLKDFIQLHSFAKQLSKSWWNFIFILYLSIESIEFNFLFFSCSLSLIHDYSNIYQLIHMIIFAYSLAAICASMLLFQIELVQYIVFVNGTKFFQNHL